MKMKHSVMGLLALALVYGNANAAKLEYKKKQYTDAKEIQKVLNKEGVPFETWPLKRKDLTDAEVLEAYEAEINKIKKERDYETADLVSLSPTTPNLEMILKKFDKEHHHTEDEVRFTIAGEGVFHIQGKGGEWMKVTVEPGDLLIVPALRRHFFLLTDKKTIRCIRLFKTKKGWEAIYEKPTK